MNARVLLLALAAVAPVGAMAEPPAPTATMMIHCAYGTWPTRDQVARNLRIPGVTVGDIDRGPTDRVADAPQTQAQDEARQLQQFIRREGRHQCERGATHVQVDFHPQPGRRVTVATR